MSETTHVQTEFSNEKYRQFRMLAEERDMSLTAALHEAAEIWMQTQQQVDPNDPLFGILDQLEAEPLPDKPRTNAAAEDDLIEDWSGATTSIQFSETDGCEE